MNFPDNITTNENEDSILNTRVDSLNFPSNILNVFVKNNIRTVRGLINKNNHELGLDDSQLSIIEGILSELSLKINVESRRKEPEYQELLNQRENSEFLCSLQSKDYENIATSFANHFSVDKDVLIGQSRKKEIVKIRDVMVYVLRKYSNLSFPAIAEIIGNRDHSTIIHSFRKMEKSSKSFKDFEDEFHHLIVQSKEIKEKKDQIEKSLINKIALSLENVEQDKIKTLAQINIPERNIKVLDLYRQGLSLNNIGKVYNITRERARQIIIRTIKQEVFNESVSTGIKIDFNNIFNKERDARKHLINSNKPTKEPKKSTRKYEWSVYYESCKVCNTTNVPHFRKGLCEECGNKSVTGDLREKIIKDHNNKCDMCGILRDKVLEEQGRDFYISRKVKSVLCRKCFLETTGKALGDIRKNKWKMFYN